MIFALGKEDVPGCSAGDQEPTTLAKAISSAAARETTRPTGCVCEETATAVDTSAPFTLARANIPAGAAVVRIGEQVHLAAICRVAIAIGETVWTGGRLAVTGVATPGVNRGIAGDATSPTVIRIAEYVRAGAGATRRVGVDEAAHASSRELGSAPAAVVRVGLCIVAPGGSHEIFWTVRISAWATGGRLADTRAIDATFPACARVPTAAAIMRVRLQIGALELISTEGVTGVTTRIFASPAGADAGAVQERADAATMTAIVDIGVGIDTSTATAYLRKATTMPAGAAVEDATVRVDAPTTAATTALAFGIGVACGAEASWRHACSRQADLPRATRRVAGATVIDIGLQVEAGPVAAGLA